MNSKEENTDWQAGALAAEMRATRLHAVIEQAQALLANGQTERGHERLGRILRGEEHTHITRNIYPPGKCPACDRYHEKHSSFDSLFEAFLADATDEALPEIDGNFGGQRPSTAEVIYRHTNKP
ncbi:hypothetical protein [Ornithinimicrobium murale]|uniref:hypothetical protein n=1 Tax=Ornithinimicrobium murale TaxID=1050153 RepID=UPI000E0D47D2|nr:hypothetical protein [Ornithinimicrobium murale]